MRLSMKKFLKIIGILGVVIVLAIGLLVALFFHEKAKYARTAVPYIQEVVPEIAANWDPAVARHHFASWALDQAPPGDMEKIFKFLSKLGKLKRLGDPSLRSIYYHAGVGTIISYAVDATFDAGEAMISVGVLDDGHNLSIVSFYINSMALVQ